MHLIGGLLRKAMVFNENFNYFLIFGILKVEMMKKSFNNGCIYKII